jgi:3-methyladenine DNA glycosylase/8-oxoguanine DNA glycosylase
LLAHGRWFSLGTPASSTTKTGRHDIAEILLKVVLKQQNSIKAKNQS